MLWLTIMINSGNIKQRGCACSFAFVGRRVRERRGDKAGCAQRTVYDVRRHAAADRLSQTCFLCGIGQHHRDARNCAADCALTPQDGEIGCSHAFEVCQGSYSSSGEKYVCGIGRRSGLVLVFVFLQEQNIASHKWATCKQQTVGLSQIVFASVTIKTVR